MLFWRRNGKQRAKFGLVRNITRFSVRSDAHADKTIMGLMAWFTLNLLVFLYETISWNLRQLHTPTHCLIHVHEAVLNHHVDWT